MNRGQYWSGIVLGCVMASSTFAESPAKGPSKPGGVDFSQEPFLFEQVRSKLRFEADGTGSRTVQTRVLVQTEGALQQFGQLVFNYNSDFEHLTIKGRVVKPDGSIAEIPDSAIQDISSPVTRVAPVYSDIRERHLIVPGLRPGDTLEFELQFDQFAAPAPNQFWAAYDFNRAFIVKDEELRIDVPSAKYVNVKTRPEFKPEIRDANGRRVYRWKTSHLEREEEAGKKVKQTTHKPDVDDPAVQLTTFQSWGEVGEWYARLESNRRAPDEAIRAKVAEITQGMTGDLGKLQAIYNYAAQKYRYVGLSFGLGRYQPHQAAEIFRNQYGDCKDKHTLLAAMAEAAGLHLSAALTSAIRKVDATFPSPSQFDHVITYAQVGSVEVWLDTTTELAPFRMLLAPVRGKSALVVTAGGKSQLQQIPQEPVVPNLEVREIDGAINEVGTLDADVRLTLRGDAEVLARLGVRAVPQSQWKVLMQYFASALGTEGDVSNVEVSDVANTDTPLQYRFHITRLNYFNRFDAQPKLVLPLGEMPLTDSKEKDDTQPIDLGTKRVEYHLKLQLSRQFEAHLPLPVALKRDYAQYDSKYLLDGASLAAERTLSVKVNELPANRLNEFEAFRRTVTADAEQAVAVKIVGNAGSGEFSSLKVDELLAAAYAAYDSRQYQTSVDLIERVVKSEPKHKTAYNDLGRAYLGLGQVVKAEAALKKAVEINPYSPYAYNNLGRVYEAQRRFEEAEKAFRKQIEINPLDEWSHKNLGDLLVQRKKYTEAEPELEKAVAITPGDEQLYLNLGKAQINLNKPKEAQVSFDRAVELAPTPLVWNEIAYALAEHKTSLDRAQRYAESAVAAVAVQLRNVHLEDLKPQHLGLVRFLGTFWDTLGWVEFKKGNMPSAEKYLVAAWQLTQKSIVADHLGQVYEQMGKREQAIEYYAFAASVPRSEPASRAHLAALVGEAKVESTVDKERERPANLRSYAVPGAKGKGSGEFFVKLAPASRVEEVRFVSGDEKLKPLADALRRVDFKMDFPDKNDTRVIRRGILICSAPSSGHAPAPRLAVEKDGSVQSAEKSGTGSCDFILILPEDVHSVN